MNASSVTSFAKIADNVKSFSVYDSSLCFIDNNNDLYMKSASANGEINIEQSE